MPINPSFIGSTTIAEIADVTITMLQERPPLGIILQGLEEQKGKVYGYYNPVGQNVELYIVDPFNGQRFLRA